MSYIKVNAPTIHKICEDAIPAMKALLLQKIHDREREVLHSKFFFWIRNAAKAAEYVKGEESYETLRLFVECDKEKAKKLINMCDMAEDGFINLSSDDYEFVEEMKIEIEKAKNISSYCKLLAGMS